MVILILKNINFTATKNLSISDKVYSSGENYIGNIDDDYKIKLFNKIRPKQGYILLKLNGCFSWLKITNYLKNIIIFGIKSAILRKKILIV